MDGDKANVLLKALHIASKLRSHGSTKQCSAVGDHKRERVCGSEVLVYQPALRDQERERENRKKEKKWMLGLPVAKSLAELRCFLREKLLRCTIWFEEPGPPVASLGLSYLE